MTRQPYAMQTLIAEIKSLRAAAAIDTEEPDGFGIYRSIVIDPATSELVAPLLAASTDPRIASHGWLDEGAFHVQFVADPRAEGRSPFHLKRGLAVLGEEFVEEDDEDYEEAIQSLNRDDLLALSRRELDERYPEYADAKNKTALVDAVLADE